MPDFHFYHCGRSEMEDGGVECIRSREYPGRFLLLAFAGTGLAGMT